MFLKIPLKPFQQEEINNFSDNQTAGTNYAINCLDLMRGCKHKFTPESDMYTLHTKKQ